MYGQGEVILQIHLNRTKGNLVWFDLNGPASPSPSIFTLPTPMGTGTPRQADFVWRGTVNPGAVYLACCGEWAGGGAVASLGAPPLRQLPCLSASPAVGGVDSVAGSGSDAPGGRSSAPFCVEVIFAELSHMQSALFIQH